MLLGEKGRGVATIVTLVNVTRIYNSVSAIAFSRRSLEIAKNFSLRREAFGKPLVEHPLHLHTLAKLEVEVRGCVAMTLDITFLMGCAETGQATPSQTLLLRFLTPVVKLYTGKRAVTVTSEALEVLGGTGYMEDSGMPRLLRNAQVLPIWEGTTNVLSLDVLRVLRRQPQAFAAFIKEVQQVFSRPVSGSSEVASVLSACAQVILNHELPAVQKYAAKMGQMEPEFAETGSREFAFSIGFLYGAKCLFEHALWSDANALLNAQVAHDWIMHSKSGFLGGLAHCDEKRRQADHLIVVGTTGAFHSRL